MTVQWKNNSNSFIEVEWWGSQNEPRIELPEGHFVHSCLASIKGEGTHVTRVFILGKMSNK